jgi:DNA-binding NarL/FixJ family response regulator
MSPTGSPANLNAAGAYLTPRQREVLHLLSFRLTNAEIAAMLSLSPRTVECHVACILASLHVANRREAASLAVHGQDLAPALTLPLRSG